MDETSFQYDISIVDQCLSEVLEQGLEEVDVENDLRLISELIKEGVHYLEF